MFADLLNGFIFIFQPFTLLMLVFGVAVGLIVGAIPGITGSIGIILMLPMVFRLPNEVAMVMLCGLFCGSMLGGSFSAILLNTPGTPSAAATSLDGYPLAQQGKAGKAMGVAVFASFIGGLISTIALVFIAPQLSRVALQFHAADYFSLAIFGLTMIGASAGKNVLKGLISGVVGMLIATIGVDAVLGTARFTFGSVALMNGLPLLSVLIGVFAVSEVFETITKRGDGQVKANAQDVKKVMPTLKEMREIAKATGISGVIGVSIGIVPGTGGAISSFLSYNIAKKMSKNPEKFGHGSLEGIAAAESANNGTTGGAMIPMLTLGIPGEVITSVMLGALILIGVRPGPLLMVENSALVYAIFAGMFVIQFAMFGFGMAFARFSPLVLKIPRTMLMPIVIVLSVVGAFSIANQLYHVYITLIFGVIGIVMRRYGYPGAPLVLGLILGPLAESNLNRAMQITRNDWTVLFQRPISLTFLLLAALFIFMTVRSNAKEKEREAQKSQETQEGGMQA